MIDDTTETWNDIIETWNDTTEIWNDTTEQEYTRYEDVVNTTMNQEEYDYHGMNITLPAEVTFIYPWCFTALSICIASLFIYTAAFSKFPEELFRKLSLQHIVSGYYHVLCLTFANLALTQDIPFLSSVLEETYSSLDLVITFTTGCLSWIVFLRVFLFRNGEKLYTMKQIMLFSTLSLTVIEIYEFLMGVVNVSGKLLSALRLTSILLIMSVPIIVVLLLVKSLLSSNTEVPKFQALFFIGYLSLFISCDILLLRFNLYCESSFVLLWSIFLYVRLFVETIFYVIFDRCLSHFFVH